MSDAELSQFCSITSASPNQAKKYLSRFPTFESAVESFLENPEKSPIRPPDQPYNDILIDSPEKKKLIKDTTVAGKELKRKVEEQLNVFSSTGKLGSWKSAQMSSEDLLCLGRSRNSSATSFDQAKKRGLVLRRPVLVSFYDGSVKACQKQTSEIWNSADYSSILKENLLFYQNSVSSNDYSEFIRVYRLGRTIRNDEWPHAALVDPRTGALIEEFFGEEASDAERFFEKLTSIVKEKCSEDFGKKIVRKRKFDEITDQTEDEQIAIAIAASMKSTSKKPRRAAEKEAESLKREFEEPEMNSDFESVSEGEDESDEEESCGHDPELAAQGTDEHQKVTDESSRTSAVSICFQIRSPENKRTMIKMLETADASSLRMTLLNMGYCQTEYELIRAYPKEVMDLSEGRSLQDLKIVNQDSFLIQKKN